MIDAYAIERAVAAVIEAIGEDPHREGLRDTPQRVARAYAELFSGIGRDPEEELKTGFEEGHGDMVIVKDLPFYSICEHHFLPFFGLAHIGYLPNGKVAGVSKLGRVVEILAKRPQMQERLTSQVAQAILNAMHPDGVAVVTRAEHLCMTMRGIRKPGTKVITSTALGDFKNGSFTRDQFLSLVQSA